MAGMMVELEKFGVLAKVKIPKNGLSARNPYATAHARLAWHCSSCCGASWANPGRGCGMKRLRGGKVWAVLGSGTSHHLRAPA